MRRALLPIVLSTSLACTSSDLVAPGARAALMRSTSADTIRLPTADGSVVEFGPNATLHLGAYRDSTEISASELYSNEQGLFRRNGTLIATWDELTSVKVEQLDGAATVALTTMAAAAVVVIAALLKSSPSSSSSGGKSGSSSAPKASGRSAPNPSSVQSDPAAAELVFRTAEALVNHAQTSARSRDSKAEHAGQARAAIASSRARASAFACSIFSSSPVAFAPRLRGISRRRSSSRARRFMANRRRSIGSRSRWVSALRSMEITRVSSPRSPFAFARFVASGSGSFPCSRSIRPTRAIGKWHPASS